LALAGLLGERLVSERVEGLQVTVSPAGGDGIRIDQVIDQDFGPSDRHGPELVVPTDFGEPTEVTAKSPDAPAGVNTAVGTDTFSIRIGDPDTTVTGQHRYRVTYVLPDAKVSSGQLALDAVGAQSDIPIDHVEVLVSGFRLSDPTCNVGGIGATGGCELRPVDGGYRVRVEHLAAHQGITIGGAIGGRNDPVTPAARPVPPRRQTHRPLSAAVALGLGVLAAGLVYLWAVRTGSNDVAGMAAADAAFGGPPPIPAVSGAPGPSGVAGDGPPPHRVTDAGLGALATIEFAPPQHIEPWQGALVLRERIDDELVTAWFSGAVAHEWVTIESDGPDTLLAPGPKLRQADPLTGQILARAFGGRSDLTLGSYDKPFGDAWKAVREAQQQWARTSGWWRSHPPGTKRGTRGQPASRIIAVMIGLWCAFPVLGFLGVALLLVGGFGGWVALAVVALGLPALAARFVYAPLLPGRSSAGSAYALRTESFRRFLEGSEGQHVEWAWSQGLLRQYSAWAVALGAADAWSRAMAASSVPPAEVNLASPLLVHSMGSSFSSTYNQPTSSGSSGFGGGGFSGGSVGGGGGGGSIGSW
ncbi:MAG: DUF2207 family protein, partial [Acidimicrobiales bacterium]